MTEKKCKYCDEPAEDSPGMGFRCRVCKNGLYRYGMNRLDMIALHEAQNKRCAICEKEVTLFTGLHKTAAVIDHCHTHGHVRKILCQPCNNAVGGLETHPNIAKLLEYIEYNI